MDAAAPKSPSAPAIPPGDTEMTTAQAEDMQKPANESVEEGVSAGGGEDVGITASKASLERATISYLRELFSTDAFLSSAAHKLNGDEGHPTTEPPTQPSEPSQASEDTHMKDTEAPMASVEETAAGTAPSASNGTPVINKRASISASSKKKSSAVPEHKSKKLNKKKSKPLTNLDAQPGQYYFARMKGHPPWPSIICDEEMLPLSLLTTRPVTAALPDGSFKKADYADGGKRAYERTFPVMFLHTNEFAWIPNTELAPLETESDAIKNPPEKGKSKTLLAAYAKAAEANGLSAFKTMLAEHQKAMHEDMVLQEERAAKKEEKSKRAAARKSSTAAVEDDDEMDVDDETGAEKPKSKKRKKAAEDSDIDEKPAKTPKTTTKLKLSTPKQPAESATKKKAAKPKKQATKSGSDEDAQTPKVEEKPLSPAALKEIKEKKVLYYRHKLQRGFLSRDTVPKAEEMKSMSDFLSELELFPDLEGSIIRATKIHKVLKQMIKLDHIPLEEEFKFKDRSTKLLSKWNDILSSDGPSDEKGDDKDEEKPTKSKSKDPTPAEDSAPTTNGGLKSNEPQAEKAKAGEAAAPESESKENLEKKIGTTVEGEKEADAQKPAEEATKDAEMTVGEKTSDGPAIETAPAEEYKPPQQEAMDTT